MDVFGNNVNPRFGRGSHLNVSSLLLKNPVSHREYCSKSYGDVVNGLCSVFSSPTGDISTVKGKKALILGAHMPKSGKLNCFVALKGKSLAFFPFTNWFYVQRRGIYALRRLQTGRVVELARRALLPPGCCTGYTWDPKL